MSVWGRRAHVLVGRFRRSASKSGPGVAGHCGAGRDEPGYRQAMPIAVWALLNTSGASAGNAP